MKAKKLVNDVLCPMLSLLFLIVVACSSTNKKEQVMVKSPDGNYAFIFSINDNSEATYGVNYIGNQIIGTSGLGFEIPKEFEETRRSSIRGIHPKYLK